MTLSSAVVKMADSDVSSKDILYTYSAGTSRGGKAEQILHMLASSSFIVSSQSTGT